MTQRLHRTGRLSTALAALAVAGLSIRAFAVESAPPTIVLSPRNLKYEPIPDMPSCATAAILRGNPRNGPFWALLKLTSGCRVPLHWHSANEDLLVVSGQGTITMIDAPPLVFEPGAYAWLPAGHMHQASCTHSCLLLSSSDGAYDIHYMDKDGKEISLEKALKALPAPRTKPASKTKRKK